VNEPAQRFEHRVIRLFSSEALDALSSSNPQIRPASGPVRKRVYQRCFADPCFARYEDHLPLASQCCVKAAIQLGQ
jgi:hypothetical protein